MRTTHLFFRTSKEAPSDADITSHQLLERGGYIKKLGKGIFSYTPLMVRVLEKITAIMREELNKAGCQEISLPLLHPAELWKKTGRWEDFTSEKLLYTIEDREGHPFCLAPTHEEVVVSLVTNWATSYKQFPFNLYQIGTKFRDEIRPRFGLMRCKEFLMKDGYSFSRTPEEMDRQYLNMREAYSAIFRRLGLRFVIVEAHGGKIGKGKSEEFQVVADIGEDAILVCGDYAANIEATKSIPPPFPYKKDLVPMERVKTPGTTTIEALSAFLKVEPAQILKTLIYKLIFADREEFVAIGIRGDRQVNELKVGGKFGAIETVLATEEEVKRLTGAKFGFIGPLDLKVRFFADQTSNLMTNFVCAYNVDDMHALNVNWERDLPKPEWDDFLLAQEGDSCPHIPGGVYRVQRGIEVGHIFNLGTKYTERLGANYQDENGVSQVMWMGTYGIGVGRTAAACIEQSHDERGMIWPQAIAPFLITISPATTNDPVLVECAEKIYKELGTYEPLLDDRDERLGFKLRDSDLIGIPYKLIVGKSYIAEGKVEIESRKGEKVLLSLDQIKGWAEKNLCR